MLKPSLIALMAAALLCVAAPGVLWQEAGGQQPTSAPAEHEHAHAQMDPAKRAAMLAKHLKLNSDQQSKVEDILKSQQSQMESLQLDTSLSNIHKSSNDQIRGLLDADQQKRWDEMQSKHEERMEKHHHGQAQDAAPTSPQ